MVGSERGWVRWLVRGEKGSAAAESRLVGRTTKGKKKRPHFGLLNMRLGFIILPQWVPLQ